MGGMWRQQVDTVRGFGLAEIGKERKIRGVKRIDKLNAGEKFVFKKLSSNSQLPQW